ncbi:MAG TPA: hypothetical protein VGG39_34800 [Polyangiaceae bacterium]|jgi:hypothetical protein
MNRSEAVSSGEARSASVVRQHRIPDLDGPIHGITYDGKYLVLAAGSRLVRIVPDTGRVVDQLETFPSEGGLAFDGEHYWQASAGDFLRIDRRTGLVLWSLSPGLKDATGIACIGSDLVVVHEGGRAITRFEPRYESIVGEVNLPLCAQGLTLAGGEMWCTTPMNLRRIDPATGHLLATAPLPQGILVRDLTGDEDGRFWVVDGTSNVVQAIARPLAS